MSQRTGHKRPRTLTVTLPLLAVLCLISGHALPEGEAAPGSGGSDLSAGPVRDGILTREQQEENGSLVIGVVSTMDFVPLPPALLRDGPERWIMEQTYGPGLILPPLKGVIEPGLILESEGFNEVGTDSFTFTLRQGITFHDGTVLTPEHVKNTYDRLHDLANGPFCPPELDPAFALIDTIRIDRETNQIIIQMPSALREQLLRIAATAPLHPDFLPSDTDVDPLPYIVKTADIAPKGLGAYKPVYVEDTGMVILNEHREYFDDRPIIRNITVRLFSTDEEMNRAFITGEVKLVRLPTLKAFGTLLTESEGSDLTAREGASYLIRWYRQPNHFFYLAFNTSRDPLNISTMRRALAHAIKRTDLDFRDEPPGWSIITDIPLHPDSRLGQRHPGQSARAYAPRTASLRRIRENPAINNNRAGYPLDGEGNPYQLELIYPGHVSHYETLARRIKNNLENLQIQVEVTEVSPEELRDRIREGDYQLALSEMTLPPTVDALQRLFWSGNAWSGLNFTRFVNDEFDTAVQGAILHRQGRRVPYNWRHYANDCVSILFNEVPLLPLFFQANEYYFFDNNYINVDFLGPNGGRLAPMYKWRRR